MTLNCNGKILDLHTKKIMGIINLSQDSFYDGGRYDSIDKVNAQISNLVSNGAEIIKLYDKNMNESFELMLNKNHDYGEAWREMEVVSLTDLIIQKIYRMKSILKNDGKTNVSEGIDANLQDILNYSIFAQILLKE